MPACPRCYGPLARSSQGERCPEGHGVWLDHDEVLDRLAFDPLRVLRPPAEAEASPLRCLACATRMRLVPAARREGGHVLLDACPACGGTWLDAGELEVARRTEPGWSFRAFDPSLRDGRTFALAYAVLRLLPRP